MGADLPIEEPWHPRGISASAIPDSGSLPQLGTPPPMQLMRAMHTVGIPYRLVRHTNNLAFIHSPIRILLALFPQSQVDSAVTKTLTCPHGTNTQDNECGVPRDLTQRPADPTYVTVCRQPSDVMAGTALHNQST